MTVKAKATNRCRRVSFTAGSQRLKSPPYSLHLRHPRARQPFPAFDPPLGFLLSFCIPCLASSSAFWTLLAALLSFFLLLGALV